MLPVKSKYKIGKRLGPAVFEQCQTQKFALSDARSKNRRDRKGRRGGSDYARQLLEKQRLRFTYGLSEKQLSNYAKNAFASSDPVSTLFAALELRADNAIYRAGFARTRRAARQAISHGHITINGRRITIPSFRLKKGDVIAVREGSRKSPLFSSLAADEMISAPEWVAPDHNLMRAEIVAAPTHSPAASPVDFSTVFEFYSR